MNRKRISCICLAALVVMVFLVGCSGKGAADSESTPTETIAEETTQRETVAVQTEEETLQVMVGEEGPGAMESSESQEPDKKAEAFAEKIQEAVSDRNLDTLADLLFYPCVFITGDQEKIILEKRDDLTKQNPDMVFGDDLMVAVANVDTGMLEISPAGIVLGEGESRIIYQVKTDGTMGITEIKE